MMRLSMPSCSLRGCFIVCVTVQLWFMVNFGPRLFGNDEPQLYVTLAPLTYRETTSIADSATSQNNTTLSLASSTTTHPPQPTVSISPVEKEINSFMHQYEKKCIDKRKRSSDEYNLCPCVPPGLKGHIHIETEARTWADITRRNNLTRPGGEWSPLDCRNTEKLAIIIPYRDRDEHLRIFLNHMHPILQRQKLSYRIFVVEQAFPEVFNKASMMNIGFLSAINFGSYDCVIFHDVDMLLEDDRHIYRCSDKIRHMGANVDKFEYKLTYKGLVGGATAFKKELFEQVNGFTNKFYGWGGEDDDMYQRIRAQKMTIVRFPPEISRYTMMKHNRDKGNNVNPFKGVGWQSRPNEYQKEGLRTLKYRIHETSLRPLYTWVYAEPLTALEEFITLWGIGADDAILTKKLNLVDCATECSAIPECNAFKMRAKWCILQQRAGLHRRCEQFECDRMYIKKTYSKQLQAEMVLNQFVAIRGSCIGATPKNSSQTLTHVQCAQLCNNTNDCAAFVHSGGIDGCSMFPINSCRSVNASFVFFKIPANVMGLFANRSGDCPGGDIEGVEMSVEQCAYKCRMTPLCTGFSYTSGIPIPCWIKKRRCTETNSADNIIMYDLS